MSSIHWQKFCFSMQLWRQISWVLGLFGVFFIAFFSLTPLWNTNSSVYSLKISEWKSVKDYKVDFHQNGQNTDILWKYKNTISHSHLIFFMSGLRSVRIWKLNPVSDKRHLHVYLRVHTWSCSKVQKCWDLQQKGCTHRSNKLIPTTPAPSPDRAGILPHLKRTHSLSSEALILVS